MLRKRVEEIFPIYESGDTSAFFESCLEVTRTLNQGKLTKKQGTKAHSIANSLDMIKNLDEDYCEFLVKKYLSKDEFVDLDERQRLLTS